MKSSVLPSVGSALQVEERPIPSAGAGQVVVRNRAVAMNPVDNLQQETGYLVKSTPTVLGSDVSGVVESVGSGTTGRVKAGDRVAGFACVLGSGNAEQGAFQEYSVVDECAITVIPDFVGFEDAATLPMAVATPGVGFFERQGIPRPGPPTTAAEKPGTGQIYLVWSAAASVGTMAVQFARALGFTVFATASERHHAYVKKLGASQVWDYSGENVEATIAQAAGARGIAYGFAAVTAGAAGPAAAKTVELAARAAKASAPAKLCLTLPWPEGHAKPDEKLVELSMSAAFLITIEYRELGEWLFGKWVAEGLKTGEFVTSPPVRRVAGGIGAVPEALGVLKGGVSGEKVVVSLGADEGTGRCR